VPAAGGFLLTDWREQMEELFEPGLETAAYREPGEIPDLLRHYLDTPPAREAVVSRARDRILAGHDYSDRLKLMLKTVRRRYA